jgi:hypothetical protein
MTVRFAGRRRKTVRVRGAWRHAVCGLTDRIKRATAIVVAALYAALLKALLAIGAIPAVLAKTQGFTVSAIGYAL